MIIRSGHPKVIRGTAPQVPGAAVTMEGNDLQDFIFHEQRATTVVQIKNTGANVIRVFFRRKYIDGVTPANYDNYLTIPAGETFREFIEIPELEEPWGLYLMAEGGTSDFEALVGLRVV